MVVSHLCLRFCFPTAYYHEFMLKDRKHLCQYMPRRKDARRLVADPTNEPNFYLISQRYPLDESTAAVSDQSIANAVSEPNPKRQRVDTAPVVVSPLVDQSKSVTAVVSPILSATMKTSMPQPMNATSEIQLLLGILEANRKKHEEEQRATLAALAILQQRQQQQSGSLAFFGPGAI